MKVHLSKPCFMVGAEPEPDAENECNFIKDISVADASSAEAGVPSAVETVLESARRMLDMQVGSLDELDRKASASLQAGSLVLPVVFGLVGVSGRTPPVAANVLLVAALVAFVGLVCCYLGATARRKVNYRPDPAGMGENGALSDSAHARRWLGREYCMATVENNSWLRRNACWTRWTNWLLVAECLAIVLAAAFTLRW